MEHAFTSDAGTAGVWTTAGNRVYCRWQWNMDNRELVVEAGHVRRSWTAPALDHGAESGIRLDLPETARDIAHLIEREAGRS